VYFNNVRIGFWMINRAFWFFTYIKNLIQSLVYISIWNAFLAVKSIREF